MTNPMIEAAAKAMANAPGEDGHCALYYYKNLAQAAITAIEPMIRAQVEREIVEWLLADSTRLAHEETPPEDREHFAWWAADRIEAGEYRK